MYRRSGVGLVREVSDGRELWEEVRVERGGVDCRRDRRGGGTLECGVDGEREKCWSEKPKEDLAGRGTARPRTDTAEKSERERKEKQDYGRKEREWVDPLSRRAIV